MKIDYLIWWGICGTVGVGESSCRSDEEAWKIEISGNIGNGMDLLNSGGGCEGM